MSIATAGAKKRTENLKGGFGVTFRLYQIRYTSVLQKLALHQRVLVLVADLQH